MPTHTHVYVAAVIAVLLLALLGILLTLLSMRNKKKQRKAPQRVFERTAGFSDTIGGRYRGSPSTDTHINEESVTDQRGLVSPHTSSPIQLPAPAPTPLHDMPSIRSHPSARSGSTRRTRSPRRRSHSPTSHQIPSILSREDASIGRADSIQPNTLGLVERMREVQLLIIEIQRLEDQTNSEGNRDKIQALQQRITELSDTRNPSDDNYTNTFAFPMANILSEPPPAYQQRAP